MQDEQLEDAVQIVDSEFVWDGPPPDAAPSKGKKGKKQDKTVAPPPPAAEAKHEETFKLKGVHLSIPQGQLIAIVGMYSWTLGRHVRQKTDYNVCRSCRFWEVFAAPGYDR